MKKTFLFFALILILAQTVNAQLNWKLFEQIQRSDDKIKSSVVSLVAVVHYNISGYRYTKWTKTLNDSITKDSLFRVNRPNNLFAITTFNNFPVHFLLRGVNSSTMNNYEFRVLQSQKTADTQWMSVSKSRFISVPAMDGKQKMAYLGRYEHNIGERLIVDVRKKGTTNIIASAVVLWGNLKPMLLKICSAQLSKEDFKLLKQPMTDSAASKFMDKWKVLYPGNQMLPPNHKINLLKLAPKDNNLLFFLKAPIHDKVQMEYELVRNHNVIRQWSSNVLNNRFIVLKNLFPGQYLLRIRYGLQMENETTAVFEVRKPFIQLSWYRIFILLKIAGLFSIIGIALLLILQRQRTKRELAIKEKLQLELKAIYAQLNPHFVFNALSSIQGLINKQDLQGANIYLSDFARLMRDTMSRSNKEQTTLKEELTTLETYLKLEQLRFGFKYDIRTNDINVYETEIPSLLLQPIIENAVKHGVSYLLEQGQVNLEFSKNHNDMLVTIKDNGGGFSFNEDFNGHGLKLTRERIGLMNKILKGQSILLNINGNAETATLVNLTFKNWFL